MIPPITRRAATMVIRVWLEEQRVLELEPAFRANLVVVDREGRWGATSVEELHEAIDEMLDATDLVHTSQRRR